MDNVSENSGRTARGCRSQTRIQVLRQVKAIQPVGVSIRSRPPLCDKTPLTLQKQSSPPALRTPETLLEAGGPWVDQRGEFIVVLSTGGHRLRLKTTCGSGRWEAARTILE